MMKRIFTLSLAFGLLSLQQLNAQQISNWCGTPNPGEIKRQMLQNREEMRDFLFSRNAVTYVPVRFILVAKSDGSGRPNEKLALRALCHINEQYADQDIQFYLSEFVKYNNTTVYNNPTSFSGSNAIKGQMKYNAINIFITNEAADAAAYYQPPAGPGGNDWIVATSTYVDDVRVVAHEVGHFFSLPHPFLGWEESGGWDPSIHGNPVGTMAPDGQTPNELVNGTNCQIAGDGICDTPADYLFPSGNCTYNLNAKDPNGQLLSPQKENVMNYHFGCNNYLFTTDQKAAIKNSLFSSSRNYVRPGVIPNTTVINTLPTITQPQQNETVPTYNHVELAWSEVPGANFYLVEISNAAFGTRTYISETNGLTLTDLEQSKGYLWKVMAFNAYSTCTNFSVQKIFKTGSDIFSDTVEDFGLQSWWVYPNPVSGAQAIYVSTETANEFDFEITLRTSTGQLVFRSASLHVPAGTTLTDLPHNGLPAGIYLLTLQTGSAIDTKRLVVID